MSARRQRVPATLTARGRRCPIGVQRELRMGIEVELEHTRSRRVARHIACQHLWEDRRYYSKLKKVGL